VKSLLFILSLLVGQPAAAGEGGGQPSAAADAGLTWDERVSPTDRAKLARFGDCVVRVYPEQAERAVLGWPIAPKSLRILYEIDTGKCLKAARIGAERMRIQPVLMRYVLADALARSSLDRLDTSLSAQVPPLSHPTLNEAVYAPAPGEAFDAAQHSLKAKLKASFANLVALSRLGECAVRTDAVKAVALLKSEVGSAREDLVFQSTMVALEKCAVGSAVRADKLAVRGEIGAALLRLTDPASIETRSKED